MLSIYSRNRSLDITFNGSIRQILKHYIQL